MAELTKKQYLDAVGLSTFWTKAKKYIDDADKVVSNLSNLTLEYSADKHIILKNGENQLGSIDATDFVKDSFVKSGELITEQVGGVNKTFLKLTLITVQHPGTTDTDPTEQVIKIDVSQLVDAGAISDLEGRVTVIEGDVANLKTADTEIKAAATALTGRVDAHDGKIAALETADTELDGKITALDTAYKAADTALDERITALEEMDHDFGAADTALETKITKAYTDADTAVYNAIEAIPEATINALFTPAGA